MKKGLFFIISFILLVSFLLTSCSANSYDGVDNDININEGGFELEGDVNNKTDNFVNVQKLIKNVFIDIETLDYEGTVSAVKSRCSSYNGYIQESVENGKNLYSNSLRESVIVIRVPSEKLESFLGDVELLGNVLRTEINTDDVTDEYFDIETRLEALNIKKTTYMTLLEEATEISEVVSLTEALSDVIYEIESLTTKLNKYDSLVNYSTITVKIFEVKKLDTDTQKNFFEEIGDTFVSSIEALIELLKGIFLCVVAMIPFLVIPAIVLVVILIFVRNKNKKKNKK